MTSPRACARSKTTSGREPLISLRPRLRPTISGWMAGSRTGRTRHGSRGSPVCGDNVLPAAGASHCSGMTSVGRKCLRWRSRRWFGVARDGEASIRNALDRVARAASGPLDEPNKAFGPLYAGIRDYADEEGFAPYVAILRACILDHWPIAPGELVLGVVVHERRLHSLVTASRETGVGSSVIEQFLVESGALQEQDDRPPNRRLFDAQANAALLAEIPTLVGPIAMQKAMGATRKELVALEEEEILVPRTRLPRSRTPGGPQTEPRLSTIFRLTPPLSPRTTRAGKRSCLGASGRA
jgi:hypothetical protein